MTRIALDAMGGDFAPEQVVIGAVEAATGLSDVKVLLVGQLAPIQAELDKLPKALKNAAQEAMVKGTMEIVHAPDVAGMDESPVDAIKKKKDCSINVAMRLVKEGRADAFVSAGNSGAVATSAILNLGRIAGVKRPAIATVLPTSDQSRPILVLDAGANMDCAVREDGRRLFEGRPQVRNACGRSPLDRHGGLQGQRDDEGDVPAPQEVSGPELRREHRGQGPLQGSHRRRRLRRIRR